MSRFVLGTLSYDHNKNVNSAFTAQFVNWSEEATDLLNPAEFLESSPNKIFGIFDRFDGSLMAVMHRGKSKGEYFVHWVFSNTDEKYKVYKEDGQLRWKLLTW